MSDEKSKSFFQQWTEAIESIPLKEKPRETCAYCKQKSAIQMSNNYDDDLIYQTFTCLKCKRDFTEVYELKHTVDDRGELIC